MSRDQIHNAIATDPAASEPLQGTPLSSHGYSGERRDLSGLLPYGYRTYDPSGARWRSPDPVGMRGSIQHPLNFYAMVDANPATYRDARGQMPTKPRVLSYEEAYQVLYQQGLAMDGIFRPHGAYYLFVLDNLLRRMGRLYGIKVPNWIVKILSAHGDHEEIPGVGRAWDAPFKELEQDRERITITRRMLWGKFNSALLFHRDHGSTFMFFHLYAELMFWRLKALKHRNRTSQSFPPGYDALFNEYNLLANFSIRIKQTMISDPKKPILSSVLEEDNFIECFLKVDTTEMFEKGFAKTTRPVISSKSQAIRNLRDAYEKHSPGFYSFLRRGFYELGFAGFDASAKLAGIIVETERKRFDRLLNQPRGSHKLGPTIKFKLVVKDTQEIVEKSTGVRKVNLIKRYKIKANKKLPLKTIKSIQKFQRDLYRKQREKREHVDRRQLPPQEISYSDFYRTWDIYEESHSSGVRDPKSLKKPKPQQKRPRPFFVPQHDKYKFLNPEIHPALTDKDRSFIVQNMPPRTWVALQYGCAGRHHSQITGRRNQLNVMSHHHQHLMPKKGVFGYVYIDLGMRERFSDRPLARAIIYNFGFYLKRDDQHSNIQWKYMPDFTSPGPRSSGPQPPPLDTLVMMIGYRPPQSPTKSKPKSKINARTSGGRKKR